MRRFLGGNPALAVNAFVKLPPAILRCMLTDRRCLPDPTDRGAGLIRQHFADLEEARRCSSPAATLFPQPRSVKWPASLKMPMPPDHTSPATAARGARQADRRGAADRAVLAALQRATDGCISVAQAGSGSFYAQQRLERSRRLACSGRGLMRKTRILAIGGPHGQAACSAELRKKAPRDPSPFQRTRDATVQRDRSQGGQASRSIDQQSRRNRRPSDGDRRLRADVPGDQELIQERPRPFAASTAAGTPRPLTFSKLNDLGLVALRGH